MSIAALIRAMGAAGASIEVIALAVEALEAGRPRTSSAERMARKRARDRGVTCDVTSDAEVTHVTSQTVTGDVTPSPLPPSPQTPQPPTPSPGDISTPAREAPTPVSLPHAKPLADFWTIYPRKVGKRDAVQAYLRAIRRIAEPDPHRIIADGLARLLPGWAEREPDLIPHPATWLNRDGWEDEPDQTSNRHGGLQRRDRQPASPDRRAAAYVERMADVDAAFEAAARAVGSG